MPVALSAWHELGYRRPIAISDPDKYRFQLTLSLASIIPAEDRSWLESFGEQWSEPEELALLFARHERSVDNARLRSTSGQHLFDASKTLGSLRDRGFLNLEGSGKNSLYTLGPNASTDDTGLGAGHSAARESAGSEHESVSTEHESAGTEPLKNAAIYERLVAIAAPVAAHTQVDPDDARNAVLGLCSIVPLSTAEMAQLLARHIQTIRRYVHDLVDSGLLEPTQISKQHPGQRYRTGQQSSPAGIQAVLPLDDVHGAR